MEGKRIAASGAVAAYRSMGDRVPRIAHVPAWDRWVVVVDMDPSQSESWASYQEDFPHEVTVDEARGVVHVIDPGTGGGHRVWTVATFPQRDGRTLIGLTDTDLDPDLASSTWYFQHDGQDVTAEVFAPDQSAFFEGADPELLDRYALLGMVAELKEAGGEVTVTAEPRSGMLCKEGGVADAGISADVGARICEAWEQWKFLKIVYVLDPESGRFRVKERMPRSS